VIATLIWDHPGGRDPLGTPVAGEPIRVDVDDCHMGPRNSADVGGRGRDGVAVDLSLYRPALPDLSAVEDLPEGVVLDLADVDRVEVDGATYQVEGVPAVWAEAESGLGTAGIEIRLKRGRG
jgi:hypothetical protein